MTIKKIQIVPPGNNYGDILHPETDSGQVLMSDGRTLQTAFQQGGAYGTTTGTGTAYLVTVTPTPPSLTDFMLVVVKIHIDNTGSATINVNGLGAKTILKGNGFPLSAGDLKANSIYSFRYNLTNFILQGEGGGVGVGVPLDPQKLIRSNGVGGVRWKVTLRKVMNHGSYPFNSTGRTPIYGFDRSGNIRLLAEDTPSVNTVQINTVYPTPNRINNGTNTAGVTPFQTGLCVGLDGGMFFRTEAGTIARSFPTLTNVYTYQNLISSSAPITSLNFKYGYFKDYTAAAMRQLWRIDLTSNAVTHIDLSENIVAIRPVRSATPSIDEVFVVTNTIGTGNYYIRRYSEALGLQATSSVYTDTADGFAIGVGTVNMDVTDLAGYLYVSTTTKLMMFNRGDLSFIKSISLSNISGLSVMNENDLLVSTYGSIRRYNFHDLVFVDEFTMPGSFSQHQNGGPTQMGGIMPLGDLDDGMVLASVQPYLELTS